MSKSGTWRISASPPPSVLSKPFRIRSRELTLSESSGRSSTADSILCPDRGYTAARDIKTAYIDCCPPMSETSRHAHQKERVVHLRLQKTKNPSEFVLGTTFCLELSKMET